MVHALHLCRAIPKLNLSTILQAEPAPGPPQAEEAGESSQPCSWGSKGKKVGEGSHEPPQQALGQTQDFFYFYPKLEYAVSAVLLMP